MNCILYSNYYVTKFVIKQDVRQCAAAVKQPSKVAYSETVQKSSKRPLKEDIFAAVYADQAMKSANVVIIDLPSDLVSSDKTTV